MKVLVIGSGGREHALVWKLKQSPRVQKIYCAPGNGGITNDAECVPVDQKSLESLVGLANQLRPDLTVIGPEVPLQLGVVDEAGNVGVRPRTMEVASDAELQDLRWIRWDATGASATGRLRELVCEPTCATGRPRFVPASVTLSSVRECRGRSYFDAAQLSVRGEQPAVYVRAPC